MIAILTVCLVVSSSILIVAFAWNRIRGVPILNNNASRFSQRGSFRRWPILLFNCDSPRNHSRARHRRA